MKLKPVLYSLLAFLCISAVLLTLLIVNGEGLYRRTWHFYWLKVLYQKGECLPAIGLILVLVGVAVLSMITIPSKLVKISACVLAGLACIFGCLAGFLSLFLIYHHIDSLESNGEYYQLGLIGDSNVFYPETDYVICKCVDAIGSSCECQVFCTIREPPTICSFEVRLGVDEMTGTTVVRAEDRTVHTYGEPKSYDCFWNSWCPEVWPPESSCINEVAAQPSLQATPLRGLVVIGHFVLQMLSLTWAN
jgi:hypothetical protein